MKCGRALERGFAPLSLAVAVAVALVEASAAEPRSSAIQSPGAAPHRVGLRHADRRDPTPPAVLESPKQVAAPRIAAVVRRADRNPAPQGLQATWPAGAPGASELIVDMRVNQRAIEGPQVILARGPQVWLSLATLHTAGLNPPADAGEWVALHDIVGDRYTLDEARLRLDVMAPVDGFTMTRIRADRDPVPRALDPAPLAFIAGYDLAAGRDNSGKHWASLLMDATVSRGRAFCSSRHLNRSGQASARLDSQCVVDWPEHRVSLTVGDAISRSNALSAPVRYGGIRVGTDFSLQPQFHTQPLLGVEGSARLPSILEIWTQQQLVMRTELPPGPFRIDGIPALSGSGRISASIIDAVGRTTLLDAPFYSESSLLRPGLDDWAIEAGRLRTGFLTPLDRYAEPFLLGAWRRGLTSWWTGEVRAEVQDALHVLGTSHALRLGHRGIVDLGASTSKAAPHAARGQAYSLAYSYRGQRWNFAGRYLHRDRAYVDLAYPEPGSAPLRDAQLNVGVRVGGIMFSAGGLLRETTELGSQRFLTAGASMPLAGGFLSLSAFVPRGSDDGAIYGAHFTIPLSAGRTASTWADQQNGRTRYGAAYQRSVPAGLGFGYRVAHETSDDGARTTLDATYVGNAARVDVGAAHDASGSRLQGSLSGAVVATREGMFLSQDDSGSFALVSLPDAGTRIYRDNQLVAVTDARGRAIVPRLRPYEVNRLRAASEDMAFTTQVVTDAVQVTPGRRQVVRAEFQARASTPLALRLRTGDGAHVPAGAVATTAGGDATRVGHEGLLYFDDMPASTAPIEIQWPDGRCVLAPASLAEHRDATTLHDALCESPADVR